MNRTNLTIRSNVRNQALVLVGLGVSLVAGCPRPDNTGNGNSNNNGTGGATQLARTTYTGSISCLEAQLLGGMPSNPVSINKTVTFTFDADGVLSALPVFGFVGAPDQQTNVGLAGETQVLTSAGPSMTSITRSLTVRSATYTATTANLTIDIDYDAAGGSNVLSGTGELFLTLRLVNGNLSVTYELAYDIMQTAGEVMLDTGETFNCEGVLE